MISTAIAIQDATGNAVTDISTMTRAGSIFKQRETMTDEEFISAIYEYSAHLSSLTATLVTSICLTGEQMDELVSTIKEFENLEKEVE